MELCRQPWRAIAGGLGALVLFAAWPAVAAVWTPDHVVIVIEENLSPRNLVPELTYLTGLMRDNTNFTNSHAIDHPSQPNYLALFSGDAQGTGSDARRNPDGSDFPTDDAGFAQLPTVAFVVPNQINDAHGSSAAPPGANYGLAMDAWLRAHIEPYRRWAMTHNSLLIITCDEDEDDYAPVTDAAGARVAKRYINLIPTVMAGQGVAPGRYEDRVDHSSVLRTVEDFYGLAPLARGDAEAQPIVSPFRKP